jgi:hypothetical protein
MEAIPGTHRRAHLLPVPTINEMESQIGELLVSTPDTTNTRRYRTLVMMMKTNAVKKRARHPASASTARTEDNPSEASSPSRTERAVFSIKHSSRTSRLTCGRRTAQE